MNDLEKKQLSEYLQESSLTVEKGRNFIKILLKENEELAQYGKTVRGMIKDGSSSVQMKDCADVLEYPDPFKKNKIIGRTRLFKILRNLDILCNSKEFWNSPRERYISQNIFQIKIEPAVKDGKILKHKNGEDILNKVTLVTTKGIHYIRRILDDYAEKCYAANK